MNLVKIHKPNPAHYAEIPNYICRYCRYHQSWNLDADGLRIVEHHNPDCPVDKLARQIANL